MKKWLIAILVLVSLLIVVAFAVASKRSSDEKYKREWAASEREMRQTTADVKAEVLAEKVRYVRARLGSAEASRYELCHKYPPSAAQHVRECEELDQRVKAAEENDAKHTW